MNGKAIAIAIGAMALVGATVTVGYFVWKNPSAKDDGKVSVIVTIMPQKEFVENVGGDLVSITVMVPPGQEPHSYEPSTAQMKAISDANLYFKVGSGVEFETHWMHTFEEQNPDMRVVDGSKGIPLIPMEYEHGHDHNGTGHEDEEGGLDPHIWMSPRNVKIMVQNLLEGLKSEDPENAATYEANAESYTAHLDSLIANITEGLAPHAGEKFLIYHPALGYFAYDFGLVQLAVEREGKEPTPAGLAAVIDQAKEENLTIVFVEPQFDQHDAETIADEIGGTVITINPLADDYVSNLEDISGKLISAFGDTQ